MMIKVSRTKLFFRLKIDWWILIHNTFYLALAVFSGAQAENGLMFINLPYIHKNSSISRGKICKVRNFPFGYCSKNKKARLICYRPGFWQAVKTKIHFLVCAMTSCGV